MRIVSVIALSAGLAAWVTTAMAQQPAAKPSPAPVAKPAPAAAAIAGQAKPAEAPPTRVTAADAAAIVQKANGFFNSSPTLIADFVQIGGDGRRTEGTLSVSKPGRLRFEYKPPATLQIVADGSSVAIIDRKLKTQDSYPLWQTPLKFLLDKTIDLAKDTKILQVGYDGDSPYILAEDSRTFGGSSKIKLVFDAQTYALKQWTVTDAQGFETLVTLFDIDTKTKPNPSLFGAAPL